MPFYKVELCIHVYHLNDEGTAGWPIPAIHPIHIATRTDEMAGTGDEEGDTVACRQWVLPAREFEGLWQR